MKKVVTSYDIKTCKIPQELSGFRIVLFSDTHNAGQKECRKIRALIDEARPDIVIFGGDAVTRTRFKKDPKKGTDNALDMMNSIAAKYPLYFADGNHEKRLERQSLGLGFYTKFVHGLKEAGVHYLKNTSEIVAKGAIRITGLDLAYPYYRSDRDAPAVAEIDDYVGKANEKIFEILIAHSPVFFETYAQWGADLVLSGHMHGGVVRLPKGRGAFSPYGTFFTDYAYGEFVSGKTHMIVSSGASDHGARLSLINPTEIVIINLIREEQNGTGD